MKKTKNSIDQTIERMKYRSHVEPKNMPKNIHRQEKVKCFSMGQAATQFGMGSRALYKILRKNGHFIKCGRNNLPNPDLIKKGYFENKMESFYRKKITGQYIKTYVTPNGMSFLAQIIQNNQKEDQL